jgi:hypothetical protein
MSDNGGSTDEEELDITSEKFNPLKALLSKKFKYPVQVEPLDNLATIESRIKAGGLDTDLSQIRIASKNKPGRSEVVDQERYHVTNLGRVFRKDQGKFFFEVRFLEIFGGNSNLNLIPYLSAHDQRETPETDQKSSI